MPRRPIGSDIRCITLFLAAALVSGCQLELIDSSTSPEGAPSPLPVTAAIQCVPPPSGIVAWWRGEGDAQDSAGGFGGTLNSGASFAPSMTGSGFVFDGVSGFVNMGDLQGTSMDPMAADFSVMFWLKTNQVSTTGVGGFILGNANLGQAPGFRVVYQPTVNHQLRFRLADPSIATIVDTGPVNDGLWHFFAFTRQGTTLSAYTDGSLFATATSSSVINVDSGGEFHLGGRTGDSFFQGGLDEITVFNRALGSADIAAVNTAGSEGLCH